MLRIIDVTGEDLSDLIKFDNLAVVDVKIINGGKLYKNMDGTCHVLVEPYVFKGMACELLTIKRD